MEKISPNLRANALCRATSSWSRKKTTQCSFSIADLADRAVVEI
jgi:hypothetical protein